MSAGRPGLKLTTYFEERDRSGGRFLADELFDVYERHRMRTSVLLRGVVGFGRRHELHTDRLLTASETLPAVSVAIDGEQEIARALPDVLRVARHGLISLERTRLASGPGLERLGQEIEPASARDGPAAVKLTVYGGRGARSGGQPGYVAALELLRQAGAAGGLVLLGVDGTLHGERQRARFFARNANVPLMLLAIGAPGDLAGALPALLELIEEPVVTLERVQVCRVDGRALEAPHGIDERDPSGLPVWQKLTVHTEEQAKAGRHPLYLELARRLHAAGAAGVTVLRGVRGFYGERPPFADRLLSLRRNVPVLVIAIDTPPAVRRWWPVVAELTRADGLVTSELVPASHAPNGGGDATLSLAQPQPPPAAPGPAASR